MCRLSGNLEASTSWNPQRLSRPVQGLFYSTGNSSLFQTEIDGFQNELSYLPLQSVLLSLDQYLMICVLSVSCPFSIAYVVPLDIPRLFRTIRHILSSQANSLKQY